MLILENDISVEIKVYFEIDNEEMVYWDVFIMLFVMSKLMDLIID